MKRDGSFRSLALAVLVVTAMACTAEAESTQDAGGDASSEADADTTTSSVTQSTVGTTTTTSTTTTTTTTTTPPSEFAAGLVSDPLEVETVWQDDRPAASPPVSGEGWVAFAAFAGGSRRNIVLDPATGTERWSRATLGPLSESTDQHVPPLVINDVLIHLEPDGQQSEGALLQGIDVTSGNVLWSAPRPDWFPEVPFRCGEDRVCTVVWEHFGGSRKIIEYEVSTGRLVAQGAVGTSPVLRDIDLVNPDAIPFVNPDYPLPPATIPGQDPLPTAPPATSTPSQEQPGISGSGQQLVRFGGAGDARWVHPLPELFPDYGDPQDVDGSLIDGVLVVAPTPFSPLGGNEVVGLDYNTGEVLWRAPHETLDCWENLPRPDNVRCQVKGQFDTDIGDEGQTVLTSYRNVRVHYQVFEPRSGRGLGTMVVPYPGWTGEGDRPSVPRLVSFVRGGLVAPGSRGLLALSTTDGEVVPIKGPTLAWCERGPVDDDGEIYPGFYPCDPTDPERLPVEQRAPKPIRAAGVPLDDGLVWVNAGYLEAERFPAQTPVGSTMPTEASIPAASTNPSPSTGAPATTVPSTTGSGTTGPGTTGPDTTGPGTTDPAVA